MRRPYDPDYVELRVYLAGRDGRPLDLAAWTAEVRLRPADGTPISRALQLMAPVPAKDAEMPVPLDARALPDGTRLTLAVLRPTRPFETWASSTSYFKLDCEAPARDLPALLRLKRPQGAVEHAFTIPAER